MHTIALGRGLKERYFDPCISDANNTLRCLYYLPVMMEVFKKDGAIRAGAHSDYSTSHF